MQVGADEGDVGSAEEPDSTSSDDEPSRRSGTRKRANSRVRGSGKK